MNNFIAYVLGAIMLMLVAIAGLTYLGPGLLDNSGKIDLATYSSQAAQINASIHAYMAENGGAAPGGSNSDIAASLVQSGYLQDFPTGPWIMNDGNIYRQLPNLNECVQLNKAAMLDMSDPVVEAAGGCPVCTDALHQMYPGCQRPTPADAIYAPYDPSVD